MIPSVWADRLEQQLRGGADFLRNLPPPEPLPWRARARNRLRAKLTHTRERLASKLVGYNVTDHW